MNWAKVIEALQNSAKKIYQEIGDGKYSLDTAHSQMAAATVLDRLSSALLNGLKDE